MSVSPDTHSGPNIKSQMIPTVDSVREKFRKYLEDSGMLEVITRISKDLYEKEEKPEDPLLYFTYTVEAVNYDSREIIALKDEIQDLKLVIDNLEKENTFLRAELDKAPSA